MDLFIAGVERRKGVAKASGNEFDFTQVHILVPVEGVEKSSFSLTGGGFKPSVLRSPSTLVDSVAKLKLPGWYSVELSQEIGMDGELTVLLASVNGPSK